MEIPIRKFVGTKLKDIYHIGDKCQINPSKDGKNWVDAVVSHYIGLDAGVVSFKYGEEQYFATSSFTFVRERQ